MTFKLAPLDGLAKLGTKFFLILLTFLYALFLCITAISYIKNKSLPEFPLMAQIILLCTPLLFFFVYALVPRSYFLSEKGLMIRRLFSSLVIHYESIQSVEFIPFANLERTLANYGLFGYCGSFIDNNKIKAKVYATRFENMVKVKTINETYYLSPDQSETFIKTLEKAKADFECRT